MPLSSASLRLLFASYLRMAGVSNRAGLSCSSGVSAGMGGLERVDVYSDSRILYMIGWMCIENPVIYTHSHDPLAKGTGLPRC